VRGKRIAGGQYDQLTHDYLVPSLREWLTRKQKQTRRGRAELRLADRAALWSGKPENRHLPAWWEWLNIRLYTRQRDWTAPQRQMMRQAGRYHGVRALALALLLLLIGCGAWEGHAYLQAQRLGHAVLVANTEDVPAIVQEMAPYRRYLNASLRQAYVEAKGHGDRRKQLHASLALLPVDDNQVPYLQGRLLEGEPQEVVVIRTLLRPYRDRVSAELWPVLLDRSQDMRKRLRAACALAELSADDPRWKEVQGDVAERLVAENAFVIGHWAKALEPVRQLLLAPLGGLLVQEGRSPAQRSIMARLYGDYAAEQPAAFGLLEEVLARKAGADATAEDKLKLARQQANAAVALAAMGRWEKVVPLLQHSSDPTLRSYLIDRLGPGGWKRGRCCRC
jgi:hypothetical protein